MKVIEKPGNLRKMLNNRDIKLPGYASTGYVELFSSETA